MAKIKISKKEIEKMLKDQLSCKEVKWDKNGNANVELDLDKLEKKEKVVKEEHHYYHDRYKYWWPSVWYGKSTATKKIPTWQVTCGPKAIGQLTYCR